MLRPIAYSADFDITNRILQSIVDHEFYYYVLLCSNYFFCNTFSPSPTWFFIFHYPDINVMQRQNVITLSEIEHSCFKIKKEKFHGQLFTLFCRLWGGNSLLVLQCISHVESNSFRGGKKPRCENSIYIFLLAILPSPPGQLHKMRPVEMR